MLADFLIASLVLQDIELILRKTEEASCVLLFPVLLYLSPIYHGSRGKHSCVSR